jgi:hypothetical protein
MMLKFSAPQVLDIHMQCTMKELQDLRSCIGKMNRYDLFRAGCTKEEVQSLSDFHNDLTLILSRMQTEG